jgi:integrase
MPGRAPNGASSIYQGKDGKWHGRVTMGTRDDGRPDRRHLESKSRAKITRKVRDLEKQRDSGRVQPPGRAWTVEQWLRRWVEHIAAPFVSENTAASYRVAVRVHLAPGVGAHRLDRLQPEHLERLYVRMMAAGSSAGTAHRAHRTIRTALGEAVRRGYLLTNPAELAKPPRLSENEVEPFTVEDVQRILTAAGERRNGIRWAVGRARQGEALGLRWSDVDLDAGALAVRRSRNRPRYEHGCGGSCGKDRAGYCPARLLVRADAGDTKSANGRRVVGLPAELVNLLHAHRAEQDRERKLAAQLWQEENWVFTSPTGQPMNPSTDYHEWNDSSAPPASARPASTTPDTPPPPFSWCSESRSAPSCRSLVGQTPAWRSATSTSQTKSAATSQGR